MMSSWAIVAIVAIVIWGVVTVWSRRHDRELGVTRDEDGNPVFAPRADGRAEDAEARAEIARLRERIVVLERIVTDRGYSLGDEIERLRDERSVEDAPLPGIGQRAGTGEREHAR